MTHRKIIPPDEAIKVSHERDGTWFAFVRYANWSRSCVATTFDEVMRQAREPFYLIEDTAED